MRGWRARSLRMTIFVAFSALILTVLLATLGITQLIVGRDAVRALDRDLRTTGQVFVSLLAERATRLQTNSTLLADDFALKRVYATHFDPATYDADTLASAGLSYRQRLGVQLVWMTDETGNLLAASPAGKRMSQSLADFSPLKEALQSQSAAVALVEVDGKLFQMVAVPVLGPEVIGFLLLGQIVDDSVAARLKQDTRSDITFLTASRAFATSWALQGKERTRFAASQLAKFLQGNGTPNPALSEVGKRRFLSLALPIKAHLSEPLYALVQGSYDDALAPLHALQWRITTIGLLALAGALLTGMILAGSITGPIRLLVEAMHEVLRGNLRRRAHLERSDELGFLARSFNAMVGGLEDRERIRHTFGRFVSRDVAAAVLDGRVPLAGERLEVSILFQDIRGFSALAETLDPAALLRMLNRFFTEVVAAVEAEGGVVKQFTGDGVMALFGAPQPRPDHVECAARAALGIVDRLARMNLLLQPDGTLPLQIGIGIHTGEVVAGLIGPDERVEYGVVGEPVNLASRIEGLTKDLTATVLVSKQIAVRLGPHFLLGRAALVAVKGKTQPIEVVELLAKRDARTDSAA
jgi:class 3 adenylate cyclase